MNCSIYWDQSDLVRLISQSDHRSIRLYPFKSHFWMRNSTRVCCNQNTKNLLALDLQQRLWSTQKLGRRKKMENIEKWILQFVPDVEAVFVLLVIRDMECSNWPPQHTLLRCLLGPAWLVGLFEVLSSSRKMKGAALPSRTAMLRSKAPPGDCNDCDHY